MIKKFLLTLFISLLSTAIGLSQLHHFSIGVDGGGNIPTQTAGIPFFIEVLAKDSINNTITSFNGTVDITSSAVLAIGGGTTSSFINGVLLSHQIKFTTTGNFTLTATKTSGIETGTSNTFTVNPDTPSKILVESASDGSATIIAEQNIVAGDQIIAYAITRDTMNNFVANTAADTWSLQNITGNIIQSDLVASGDKKSATFTGHKSGSAQIYASSGGLTSIYSDTLTIVAGSATQLKFIQQPTNGIAGAIISPPITIQLKDAFINNVVTSGDTVIITLPPDQGTLSGTLQKLTDTTGRATFNDLSISQSGTKTLIANSSGLKSDTSVQFALDTYTITATAGANGNISPSGAVNVNYGGNQTFTITPNTGYHVDSVFVDGSYVGSVTSYPFTNVTANHTISAKFAINVYTITTTAGANGNISPSGTVNVNYGGSQTFTISPNTGYHVDSVIVDGTYAGTMTSYPFTNMTTNHTISAKFAIDQFTITASAGSNGSITPSGSVSVNYGGSQTFTILPNTGYHVDSVIVDGAYAGTMTSYPFTNVTANHSISAKFAINVYMITATAGINGNISPSGTVNVNYGGSQTFTITPNTGYHVDSVFVNGSYVGAVSSYPFTNVTANHTISAKFAINVYTITAAAGANGNISPSGAVNVNYGGSQIFTITPNIGYHVDSVLVDGLYVGAVTSHPFTNVTANHTISAKFSINVYTITATAGANGSISPSGTVNVNYGGSQTFTITPNTGYHVDSVFVDGSYVGAVTSYPFTNVTANRTISTKFAINVYTITATAGANGSISPSGTVNVNYGGSQTFTITPNTGYHVDSVFVDGSYVGAVTSYPFTNVTANRTISAKFAINVNTIAATAGANGNISPSGAVNVNYGGSQTFMITPNTGYHVDSVFVDGSYVGAVTSYPFTNVITNHTIKASFAPNSLTITIRTVPDSLKIIVDGAAYTSPKIFTWVAATNHTISTDSIQNGISDTRFVWNSWSDIGSITHTAAPLLNTTFTANFTTQYYLTMIANPGGTVTPQSGWKDSGNVVTIKAIPNSKYSFNIWSGSGSVAGFYSGYDNPAFATMNGPYTETASFKPNPINITIQTNPAGRTFLYDLQTHNTTQTFPSDPGLNHTINVVSPQQLSADVRYRWISWSDGGAAYHEIQPLTDTTFTASFLKQFLLNLTANPGGTISPTSSFLDSGKVDTINATPNTGFHFSEWRGSGTGSYTGPNNPAIVTMYSPINNTAIFAIDTITITAFAGVNGTISPAGTVKVIYGSNQLFTMLPNPGYHVDSIFVDGGYVGSGASYTITNVIAPHTITVSFTINQFTITASAGPNGTIDPSGVVGFSYGANQTFTITPNIGYRIDSVIVDGTNQGALSSYTFTNITADHTIRAVFAPGILSIQIQTDPDSLLFIADGVTYTSPHTFSWITGTNHTIAVVDTQYRDEQIRYLWKNWSDSDAKTHIVIPWRDSIYKANFAPQYYLTMDSDTNGTVAPASGWQDSGNVVVITAIPKLGYKFIRWSGTGIVSPSEISNPASVTINSPLTESARFDRFPAHITIQTIPPGIIFTIDGIDFISPRTFTWITGSMHTITVPDTQNGISGVRYVWNSWSDSGSLEHSIIPLNDSIITAKFTTQYYLTIAANVGGTITPSSGWYNGSETVAIIAIPENKYRFVNWSGIGSGYGAYNGTDNPAEVTMDSPITETANFALKAIQIVIKSNLSGRYFIYDGNTYNTPQTRTVTPGEPHYLGATSPQNGGAGIQYVWNNWSDGKPQYHEISPDSNTTYTVNFTKQFSLSIGAKPATGGTVIPLSGWQDSGKIIPIKATPNIGYLFSEWTGTGAGSYNGLDDSAFVTMNAPITDTATFTQFVVNVTIGSNPSGRTINVDGTLYYTTQQFHWIQGSNHTITTTQIQNGDTLTRYLFRNWSDGGTISHVIAPLHDTTFTSYFTTQYYLTMNAGNGGTVSPPSNWYDSDQTVQIIATPNTSYNFGGWNGAGIGSYTGTNNPTIVTMNSPITETASFALTPIRVTIQTNPSGRSFIVDSTTYNTTQTFIWDLGSKHTIGSTSLQSGTTGVRYIWKNWSDGGAMVHEIIPVNDTIFTSNFGLQYYLTMDSDTNGTVFPSSGWHDSGSVIQITATPKVGFRFDEWIGSGNGSYTGTTNPAIITINEPITELAHFSRFLVKVFVSTVPDSLQILVDGVFYRSPNIFNWLTGSIHTIAAVDTQGGATGTRYIWHNWSDNAALTHTVSVVCESTFTANFTTQYYLTMVANGGGSASPPSSWLNSGQVVPITAYPDPKYEFNNWAGVGNGSTNSYTNPATVTMYGPITETANFTRKPIQIIIQTNPPGRYFIYDGQSYNTPQTRIVYPGELHSVNVVSPQTIDPWNRHTWSNWSDGGPQYHTIFPDSNTTITANFILQHLLTINVNPIDSGTTIPQDNNYFNTGDTITIRAIPNQGYAFSQWTGDIISSSNPARIFMDHQKTITANFGAAIKVSISSFPIGRTVRIDDSTVTAPKIFWWLPATNHTITTTTPQTGTKGIQYLFDRWSDSGAISHVVSPTGDTSFNVDFKTQFYLTINSSNGGRVLPGNDWHFPGDSVTIKALPDSGYGFIEWIGAGDGSYSGMSDSTIVKIMEPITETAIFGHILSPPTLSGLEDDTIGVSTTPTLSWNIYPDANFYFIQVATDSLFIDPTKTILDSILSVTFNSIQLDSLANLTSYYWRVRARVNSDITSFSQTRKFTTLNATLTAVSPFVGWGTGFTYKIQWVSENLSGSVNIKLSTNGGLLFTSIINRIPNTGDTSWTIPDDQNILSNNCKIRIESNLNNSIYAETGIFSISSGTLPVTVLLSDSVPFSQNPSASTEYKLFSSPGIVDGIKFSDFLTGPQKVDWRAFSDNGTNENYLTELSSDSKLTNGIGYWLIKKGNLELPNFNMIMPKLDTLAATFSIQLHPGWNIIGNPFNKKIPFQAILSANNLPSSTPLRGYSGYYTTESQLEPFKGYYFFNETNLDALKIPYPFGSIVTGKIEPQVNWKMQLSFQSDINNDPENYIGIAPLAKQGKDLFDIQKPPLFMDQGFLYFSRPEWDGVYNRFSSDFRQSLGEGQAWEFEISNPRRSKGIIHFKNVEQIPQENYIVLIDLFNSSPINLREHQDYAFEMVSSKMQFKLLVGSKDFVEKTLAEMKPESFELGQNFPNPFNSSTSISFKLPQESHIKIEIYNIVGQRIKNLVTGLYQTGVHTIIWDGADNSGQSVASGVYFYHMIAGSKVIQSKKMIIAK